MGRALLGKEVGDEAIVDAPRGRIEYEIVSIQFLGSAGLNIR
jgi:transcription elongation factor GreA